MRRVANHQQLHLAADHRRRPADLHLLNRQVLGRTMDPRVTVEIANYRPINVIGEVRNAGQYAYRPGISLKDAIAMAGGSTRSR